MDDRVITLTAQIVSAHVANNIVASRQLPAFIRGVHLALTTTKQAAVEPIEARPAVAVKKSIFTDHILCLDCGGSFKTLKRHIRIDHHMTPEAYRIKWSLPPSYPIVAADYAAARSRMAKDSGLGRRVQAPPPPRKSARPKKKKK